MSELSTEEQVKYIGWQGVFYNLAKLVPTGGYEGFSTGCAASFDASVQSWTVVLAILCGILVLLILSHSRALPASDRLAAEQTLKEGLSGLKRLSRYSSSNGIIGYYIGFVILYRFVKGFVMKLVPLFHKVDTAVCGQGLTNQKIGLYYGTFGAGAFLSGSMQVAN